MWCKRRRDKHRDEAWLACSRSVASLAVVINSEYGITLTYPDPTK